MKIMIWILLIWKISTMDSYSSEDREKEESLVPVENRLSQKLQNQWDKYFDNQSVTEEVEEDQSSQEQKVLNPEQINLGGLQSHLSKYYLDNQEDQSSQEKFDGLDEEKPTPSDSYEENKAKIFISPSSHQKMLNDIKKQMLKYQNKSEIDEELMKNMSSEEREEYLKLHGQLNDQEKSLYSSTKSISSQGFPSSDSFDMVKKLPKQNKKQKKKVKKKSHKPQIKQKQSQTSYFEESSSSEESIYQTPQQKPKKKKIEDESEETIVEDYSYLSEIKSEQKSQNQVQAIPESSLSEIVENKRVQLKQPTEDSLIEESSGHSIKEESSGHSIEQSIKKNHKKPIPEQPKIEKKVEEEYNNKSKALDYLKLNQNFFDKTRNYDSVFWSKMANMKNLMKPGAVIFYLRTLQNLVGDKYLYVRNQKNVNFMISKYADTLEDSGLLKEAEKAYFVSVLHDLLIKEFKSEYGGRINLNLVLSRYEETATRGLFNNLGVFNFVHMTKVAQSTTKVNIPIVLSKCSDYGSYRIPYNKFATNFLRKNYMDSKSTTNFNKFSIRMNQFKSKYFYYNTFLLNNSYKRLIKILREYGRHTGFTMKEMMGTNFAADFVQSFTSQFQGIPFITQNQIQKTFSRYADKVKGYQKKRDYMIQELTNLVRQPQNRLKNFFMKQMSKRNDMYSFVNYFQNFRNENFLTALRMSPQQKKELCNWVQKQRKEVSKESATQCYLSMFYKNIQSRLQNYSFNDIPKTLSKIEFKNFKNVNMLQGGDAFKEFKKQGLGQRQGYINGLNRRSDFIMTDRNFLPSFLGIFDNNFNDFYFHDFDDFSNIFNKYSDIWEAYSILSNDEKEFINYKIVDKEDFQNHKYNVGQVLKRFKLLKTNQSQQINFVKNNQQIQHSEEKINDFLGSITNLRVKNYYTHVEKMINYRQNISIALKSIKVDKGMGALSKFKIVLDKGLKGKTKIDFRHDFTKKNPIKEKIVANLMNSKIHFKKAVSNQNLINFGIQTMPLTEKNVKLINDMMVSAMYFKNLGDNSIISFKIDNSQQYEKTQKNLNQMNVKMRLKFKDKKMESTQYKYQRDQDILNGVNSKKNQDLYSYKMKLKSPKKKFQKIKFRKNKKNMVERTKMGNTKINRKIKFLNKKLDQSMKKYETKIQNLFQKEVKRSSSQVIKKKLKSSTQKYKGYSFNLINREVDNIKKEIKTLTSVKLQKMLLKVVNQQVEQSLNFMKEMSAPFEGKTLNQQDLNNFKLKVKNEEQQEYLNFIDNLKKLYGEKITKKLDDFGMKLKISESDKQKIEKLIFNTSKTKTYTFGDIKSSENILSKIQLLGNRFGQDQCRMNYNSAEIKLYSLLLHDNLIKMKKKNRDFGSLRLKQKEPHLDNEEHYRKSYDDQFSQGVSKFDPDFNSQNRKKGRDFGISYIKNLHQDVQITCCSCECEIIQEGCCNEKLNEDSDFIKKADQVLNYRPKINVNLYLEKNGISIKQETVNFDYQKPQTPQPRKNKLQKKEDYDILNNKFFSFLQRDRIKKKKKRRKIDSFLKKFGFHKTHKKKKKKSNKFNKIFDQSFKKYNQEDIMKLISGGYATIDKRLI